MKKCQNQFGLNPRAWALWQDNGSVHPPANLAIFGQKVPMHMWRFPAKFGNFWPKSAKVAISSEIWRFLAKKRQCGDFLWNFAIYGQKAQMCNFQWNLVIMCQFGDFWWNLAISSTIWWFLVKNVNYFQKSNFLSKKEHYCWKSKILEKSFRWRLRWWWWQN